MKSVRARNRLPLRRARIGYPSLRAKVVSLVICAALVPAALVGVASYLTVQRIQAEEVAGRLGERAASAERQVSRFLETRRIATRAVAGSRTLTEGLETWERARLAGDSVAVTLAREQLERYLASVQHHDAGYQGLALFDRQGALVASTARSTLWNPEDATVPMPASGEGRIQGSGRSALLHLDRTVHRSGGGPAGRLRTVSSLESLWGGLAGSYDEIPGRLRIVNGRLRTLFDSASRTDGSPAALPPVVTDRLLEVRVGNATYDDESGVEVVAAHRFRPSLDFGALIELPAAEASATSRRLLDFALRGSLATIAMLAVLGSLLALHLTRPLRSLVGEIGRAENDPSHRIAVAAPDEVGAVTIAVNQMLDGLEKSSRRLERLASTDELTGLCNRRHLDKMFEIELNRASRSRSPLSVLMIDLDRFAAFNERLGRPQGDTFLQHVGSFLKIWLRATDVVARYGGAEFAALLPDTDREAAVEIAERLRAQFARAHPPRAGAADPITFSIGVATWSGGAKVEADLIQAAGRALASAKLNGRNQVRVAA